MHIENNYIIRHLGDPIEILQQDVNDFRRSFELEKYKNYKGEGVVEIIYKDE